MFMLKKDVDLRVPQEAREETLSIKGGRDIVCCRDALESSVGGTQMQSRMSCNATSSQCDQGTRTQEILSVTSSKNTTAKGGGRELLSVFGHQSCF